MPSQRVGPDVAREENVIKSVGFGPYWERRWQWCILAGFQTLAGVIALMDVVAAFILFLACAVSCKVIARPVRPILLPRDVVRTAVLSQEPPGRARAAARWATRAPTATRPVRRRRNLGHVWGCAAREAPVLFCPIAIGRAAGGGSETRSARRIIDRRGLRLDVGEGSDGLCARGEKRYTGGECLARFEPAKPTRRPGCSEKGGNGSASDRTGNSNGSGVFGRAFKRLQEW